MKSKLKNLSEIVSSANDLFHSKFNNINLLMGIMDKTLRNQGMEADAITIDCISQDKRIVILIHDHKPHVVDIALGNKEGDIYSSSEYEINKISQAVIVGMMEANFIS
ncbi:conserved hypothetical protein [Psychromonas ingrahamii 37]|uniref:Uncharacterized protein n=1 Tax=Psychromonas ingrahamii (strain DSM 17664 / CCUG 51855 / 37) TaxID=357804 RepID=A1SRX6_PSYIN|nr:hypothetical protein [Psychromonas ingrahamii]ABM02241.1 conserved hypothetical protein [Psychromonas ingrahamii 37]